MAGKMHKKFDAVATIGRYTDRNGDEKSRFLKVGVVLEGDDGRMCLKLDALPVGQDWSGFISFYPPKDRDGAGSIPEQRRDAPDDDQDENPF